MNVISPPPSVAVSSSLLDEVIHLFLGFAWTLQKNAKRVTSQEKCQYTIHFKPLDAQIGFVSRGSVLSGYPEGTACVATQVLRILVKSFHSSTIENHVFLKTISPQLADVLIREDFGDESPLIVGLLSGIPKYFDVKSTGAGKKPYLCLKSLYENAAFRCIGNRTGWYPTLMETLYDRHRRLADHDPQLGLGLRIIARQ